MKSVFLLIVGLCIFGFCIKKDTLKTDKPKVYQDERPARIAQMGFCKLIKKVNGLSKGLLVVTSVNDTLEIKKISDFMFTNSNIGDSVFVKFNRDTKNFEVE